jgi:predicted kinase
MSARVYAYLRRRAVQALETGMSVIVDAVHERPGDRSAIQEVAASAGVPFTGLWLDAPGPVLMERVRHRAPDASDADETVIRTQLGTDAGRVDWHRIDAAPDLANVVAAAAARLEILAAAGATPHLQG